MIRIFNDKQDQVLSISREKNNDKVISIFNFNDKPVNVTLKAENHKGLYTELFSNARFDLKGGDKLTLPAWAYLVLVK